MSTLEFLKAKDQSVRWRKISKRHNSSYKRWTKNARGATLRQLLTRIIITFVSKPKNGQVDYFSISDSYKTLTSESSALNALIFLNVKAKILGKVI